LTRRKNIIIEGKKKYAISPENPKEFLRNLEQLVGKNLEEIAEEIG